MTAAPINLIGKRVEIPVHYDLWAQGARYGVVTATRHANHAKGIYSDYILVKMDHPQVRRRLKVWKIDWGCIKIID